MDGGLDAGDTDAGVDAGRRPDAGVSDAGRDAGPSCAPLEGGATGCAGSSCAWAASSPGDVVALGAPDPATLPSLPLVIAPAADAGVLVSSDDPETFPSSGLLYADTVGPGSVRLFVYHVNGTALSRKVSVVLANGSPAAVQVAVNAAALAGPSSNYVY
ncbi:MAG TPA: hypothetical protein VMB50_08570, partial [Myxococcales bacterium]|nr:hypothetical protein [Myxococcales bacterium]